MKYKLNFSTSHHQFYIADKFSEGDTGSDDFWTNEAFDAQLAVGNGVLGIGTGSYGVIHGELTILPKLSENTDFASYDHVVEGSINIKSGVVQILDCPNSTLELEAKVQPGSYRVRVYSSNLASVTDDNGDDFYKIEIWPAERSDRLVLKRYNGPK